MKSKTSASATAAAPCFLATPNAVACGMADVAIYRV